MKLYLYLIIFCFLISQQLTAQRNNIWCFGDSAGIDFNDISNPVPIATSLVTRGTSASISDTSGNLLFYANTVSGSSLHPTTGIIWNRNNQLMLNGDSIAGEGWYHEMVIIPDPGEDSLYYLFSNGVTSPYGLVYSLIDIKGDSTLGDVIQKNILLYPGLLVDCISAIKHGNGRDWWILIRDSPVGMPSYNNSWRLFLVSPSGIDSLPVQNVGELNGTNLGNVTFTADGTKLCFTNLGGLIELYDFNRCTGEISSPNMIEPQLTSSPYPYTWSSEFSLSSRYLYITESTFLPSRLWQFDTWSPNIASTKTLIWTVANLQNYMGGLKRGPDNKIYHAAAWTGGGYTFPYDSTEYYLENMYMTVINFPDSAGLSCNLQPWSFYLGGKRTYKGLPNNPDYELGPLAGSLCDTLVSISDLPDKSQGEIFVYFAYNWQTAFINAQGLNGRHYTLQLFDLNGKEVFKETGQLKSQYFTKNLNCESFISGMYLVLLQTEAEKLVKKIVLQ